jgi:hypothetical protein
MTNRERRQLLDRFRASGMEGSILDVYQAYGQGRDLIAEHYEQQQQQEPVVLTTPQEQQQGLRPYHAAGDMNRSAVFKDVPPNTPFNTHGMSRPINIEKYDEQGHLVESHKSIPPGISDIPTGPHRGDVIETPAEGYRDGGFLQNGGTVKRGRKKIGGEVNPTGEDKPRMTNTWDARGIGMRNLFSGRSNRKQAKEDMMSYKVANYMTEMYDRESGKFRTEGDPRAAKYIQDMFAEVGAPNNNSVDNAWSAATVSHFAKTLDPEFEGSPLHADYVNRAFQKEGNYRANRVKRNKNYEVGDILFRGRLNSSNPEWDSSDWKFSDFKKAGEEGRRYSSHTDIIVGTGSDEKGTYYEVLGGNRGIGPAGTQTTKVEKLYAKDINRRYQGAMQTGRRVNPSKPSNTTFKGRTTRRLRRK